MLNNFIRGVATQIAASALRNVSNKLPGINLSYNPGNGSGGANTHDFKSLEPVSEQKYYTFPLDELEKPGVGNQGHYMVFFINQQQKATLSFGSKSAFSSGGGGNVKTRDVPQYIKRLNANGQYATVKNISGYQDIINLDQMTKAYVAAGNDLFTAVNPHLDVAVSDATITNWFNYKRRAVAIERAPTKRMTTAIAMYMPATVSTSYGAQYTDTEIGAITEEAINAYERFAAQDFRGGFKEIAGMSEDLADSINLLMLNTVGALPGFAGVREASEMRRGVILADRLELAFKGIDKRKFEYEFKMIPKSQKEAEEIRKIIFAFKSSMMPEFEGGNLSGRKLIVPNTFDIEYMWNGAENHFINRVSECVLTNMNVSYGGDRYKTYEGIDGDGAPPIETTISLSFSELELITREKIHQGF